MWLRAQTAAVARDCLPWRNLRWSVSGSGAEPEGRQGEVRAHRFDDEVSAERHSNDGADQWASLGACGTRSTANGAAPIRDALTRFPASCYDSGRVAFQAGGHGLGSAERTRTSRSSTRRVSQHLMFEGIAAFTGSTKQQTDAPGTWVGAAAARASATGSTTGIVGRASAGPPVPRAFVGERSLACGPSAGTPRRRNRPRQHNRVPRGVTRAGRR